MAKKKVAPVDDYSDTLERLAGLAYQLPRPAEVAEALMYATHKGNGPAKALCHAALALRVAAIEFVQASRAKKR